MLLRKDPLTKRERAELAGYVSRSTAAGRAILFGLALAAMAGMALKVQRWLSVDQPWWVVPTAAVGLVLYWRSGRWTGGRDLRARIRRDLEANTATVRVLSVVDAIRVDEAEDEGPTFFLKLETGETVAILGLGGRGERVVPSLVKPPLRLATVRELGITSARWKVLPIAFDELRRVA